MGNVSRQLLRQLAEFDTALLANTIGYIDPTPAEEYYMGGSIQCATPGLGPTAGIAFTCTLDTSTPGGEANVDPFWEQVEQMAAASVPAVWVVKAVGSRPDHECVLGDGMAKTLFAAGCLGAVTDGGVRDIAGLMTIPFAAYCRGRVIHHCHMRYRSIGEPVEVGGIVVRSGDVIHADSGGVIRIPQACLEQLPKRAVQMQAFEREAHLWLRRDDVALAEKRQRVKELLAQYGFV